MPAFLAVAVALILTSADRLTGVSTLTWFIFVVCIDVAHVYSTLFRTYFSPSALNERKNLFVLIPVAVWACGVVFYSIYDRLFWSTLAYLAVFHFVRQQYGFLRLYSRHEERTVRSRTIDAATIYVATLYPMIYWHSNLPRNFQWFIEGDFFFSLPPSFEKASFALYIAILSAFVAKEFVFSVQTRSVNSPKLLIVAGTIISWYVGIVAFNGDLIFTITNVVAHGIPYLALVWGLDSKENIQHSFTKVFRFPLGVLTFLGILIAFAYFEEALWASLVWREHLSVFGGLENLPQIKDHSTLALLVPLLALPQATHYVLDGFIWKIRSQPMEWQKLLFDRKAEAA